MFGINQNFFCTGMREFFEFGIIKEEHDFILLINTKNMVDKFVGITADSSKTRAIHSTIYSDSHGDIVQWSLHKCQNSIFIWHY